MKFFIWFISIIILQFSTLYSIAQTDCNSTNTNLNVACNQTCIALAPKLRNIKSTDNYIVQQVPYSPFPYTNADGNNAPRNIYEDDSYSSIINMPFPFCFYGQFYNQFVFGSNGIVTFETSNANLDNSWPLTSRGVNGGSPVPIPATPSGFNPNDAETTHYPRAAIMGPYHDIDPTFSISPRGRIEWKVFGTAPCRRVVISFSNIRTYDSPTNDDSFLATHQIVLYENTGVIDVNIKDKPIEPGWNDGLAILGIQNWDRNRAVTVSGRNCTPWTATNESYRFYPNGITNYLIDTRLYDNNGALVRTLLPGDVTFNNDGTYTPNFGNICPTSGTSKYVIKSRFAACFSANNSIEFVDTFTIVKPPKLIATPTIVPTPCGTQVGSITIGSVTNGNAPFTYTMLGMGAVPPNGNVFANLGTGFYNIVVSNGNVISCDDTLRVFVPPTDLTATAQLEAQATCSVGNDGVITATGSVAQTYEYSINEGRTFQPTGRFTGLAPGRYRVLIRKVSDGCLALSNEVEVTVINDLTASFNNSPSTCRIPGDGIISIEGLAGSLTGYTFSLDGNPPVTSTMLTSGSGLRMITIFKNGCFKDTTTIVDLIDNFVFNAPASIDKCANRDATITTTSNFPASTSVLWTPTLNIAPNPSLTPVTSTPTNIQYSYVATYGVCTRPGMVDVSVYPLPVVNAGLDDTLCYLGSGQLNGTVTGDFRRYFWTPATNLSDSTVLNPAIASSTTSIQYVLNAEDNYGCDTTIQDTVNIRVLSEIKLNMLDTMLVPNQVPTPIDNFLIDPSEPISSYVYTWTPATDLNDANAQIPLATLNTILTPANDPRKYNVRVQLADCFADDSIYLIPYLGPDIYIPTAFVPESGVRGNNLAKAIYVGIRDLKYFAIYNRWGKQVFYTRDQFKGWDGRVNGVLQPTSVFVVVAEGIDILGRTIKKQQTITLIR
jgi:hypothetical protein